MNTENKKRVVVIASNKWDDPMTDMETAWGYSDTIWYLDEKRKETIEYWHGTSLAKERPELEIIAHSEFSDEERIALYNEIRAAEQTSYNSHCEVIFNKYQKELDEINEKKMPQNKNQVVKIYNKSAKGKSLKNDGRIGKVVWWGKDSYKNTGRTYANQSVKAKMWLEIANARPFTAKLSEMHYDDDLVLVVPLDPDTECWEDGVEKVYIAKDKVKVILGYEPVKLTLEDVKSWNHCMHNVGGKMRGDYDYNDWFADLRKNDTYEAQLGE